MKILQVVKRLGYGGVETYTARLSRALTALGHEVAILTAGGPLEALLAETGVEVIHDPLTAASLTACAEALRGRGFDLINAQNYGSARLGRPLARSLGLPYVMTVHGPRSRLQVALFRAWSKRVITISASDKANVTGLFGIAPERVVVSRLLIDPERHRPGLPAPELAAALNPHSDPLIVHISRFTNRKALAAEALLAALPTIREAVPEARLLLLCAGGDRAPIEARAAELRQRLGPCVEIIGPRLDLDELFRLADVTVATATTAIEAMACGSPLVAAGRTGYFGRVDRESFARGHAVLFADHGRCPRPTTAAAVAEDVIRILTDREAQRVEAAALAVHVAEVFDPERVAREVAGIYAEVIGLAARASEA